MKLLQVVPLMFPMVLSSYHAAHSKTCDNLTALSSHQIKEHFQLMGSGIFTYSWLFLKIDVYKASYYRSNTEKSELITLVYKRNISKNLSVKGWEQGLERNLPTSYVSYLNQLSWIKENTPHFKTGDRFTMLKELKQTRTVKWFKNDCLIASSNDPTLIKILFLPWLGTHPVAPQLKSSLMGKSNQ